MAEPTHIPVLLREVLEHLQPEPNERFIDGTVGQGGHAAAILKAILPEGRLLGIDRDPRNLSVAKEHLAEFSGRTVLVHDSYANAPQHAKEHGFEDVDGILLDVGFSSAHVDDAERGFSFMQEGPLDMRYDTTQDLTAAEVVNAWPEDELARIFRVYGEELRARRAVQAIVDRRRETPFVSTTDLAETVAKALPRQGRLHPATKIFQAIRIAVNDELGELETALPQMVDLLKPGGRLVVISFHSLEDRLVKHFFRKESTQLKILTKRPVTPTDEEMEGNPRSRSAKLRVAQKLP